MLKLTLTPKLLMQIKIRGSRKNRTLPTIPLDCSQRATSPAIAVMIAANVIEYVNLKNVSYYALGITDSMGSDVPTSMQHQQLVLSLHPRKHEQILPRHQEQAR